MVDITKIQRQDKYETIREYEHKERNKPKLNILRERERERSREREYIQINRYYTYNDRYDIHRYNIYIDR